jgi:DNA-binding LacI/PurR family transcriptional regulator
MNHSQLKYKEVEMAMRQLARTLPIGAKIPAEKHLATTYDCNFQTVRKALKSLVEDGIIVRRIGSGSFVANNETAKTGGSPPNDEQRIGLLVYHRSNDYAQKLLRNIALSAARHDITLCSSWVTDFETDALAQAHSLSKQGCSAIILPWFPHHLHYEVTEFSKKSPLPLSLSMLLPGLEDNFCGKAESFSDSLATSTEGLCDYLRIMGKNKVSLVGPSTTKDPILTRMLTTYSVYTSKHDLPNLTYLAEHGSASMDRIAAKLKKHQGDLGILCYDDEHALRMMTAMHKINLHAPKDYAIIGHNDTDSSRYSDPPLSTLVQDFSQIGEGLLKKARALAMDTPFTAQMDRRAQLLIRETCGGKGKIDAILRKKIPSLVFLEQNGENAG